MRTALEPGDRQPSPQALDPNPPIAILGTTGTITMAHRTSPIGIKPIGIKNCNQTRLILG